MREGARWERRKGSKKHTLEAVTPTPRSSRFRANVKIAAASSSYAAGGGSSTKWMTGVASTESKAVPGMPFKPLCSSCAFFINACSSFGLRSSFSKDAHAAAERNGGADADPPHHTSYQGKVTR